jgi:hypothetical protein
MYIYIDVSNRSASTVAMLRAIPKGLHIYIHIYKHTRRKDTHMYHMYIYMYTHIYIYLGGSIDRIWSGGPPKAPQPYPKT